MGIDGNTLSEIPIVARAMAAVELSRDEWRGFDRSHAGQSCSHVELVLLGESETARHRYFDIVDVILRSLVSVAVWALAR